MASYMYKVIVKKPSTWTQDSGGACEVMSAPVERTFSGAKSGEQHIPSHAAIAFARSQHRMPAGTTICIERIRVARERVDPRDAAAGLRARNPRRVPQGLWMRYRAYEVSESGIVRRTDR